MKSVKLEKISTKEGVMFPIYKDWEEWHEDYKPKMVYITTINPMTTKGPILHEKRRGLITAIQGTVVLRWKENGQMYWLHLRNQTGHSSIVKIPAGVPFSLENNDAMLPAIVINLPDRAWHPDDEDTIKFNSWDDVP